MIIHRVASAGLLLAVMFALLPGASTFGAASPSSGLNNYPAAYVLGGQP